MAEKIYKDESGELFLGDALDSLRLLESESVDFCVTSPPYWALRDYGVDGQLGQEPDFRDFVSNLATIFGEVQRVLKPTGSLWVVINDTWFSKTKGTGGKGSIQDGSLGSNWEPRNYVELLRPKSLVNVPHRLAIKMTDDYDWIHRMTVCWHKNNVMPQPHADKFTRDFEYILVFTKNGQSFHKQLTEVSKTDSSAIRNMRCVWDFDTVAGEEDNFIWEVNNNSGHGLKHYATYPAELVKRAIEFGCPEGGVVLDPFMGSGTTALVAKSMGRKWVGCEISPAYCDTILDRVRKG